MDPSVATDYDFILLRGWLDLIDVAKLLKSLGDYYPECVQKYEIDIPVVLPDHY